MDRPDKDQQPAPPGGLFHFARALGRRHPLPHKETETAGHIAGRMRQWREDRQPTGDKARSAGRKRRALQASRAVPLKRRPTYMNIAGAIAELTAIRDRVRSNVPQHQRPEAFHEEKSEIARDLSSVIEALGSISKSKA